MRILVLSLLVACSSSTPVAPLVSAPAPARAPTPVLTLAERTQLKIEGMAAYDRKDWQACATALDRAEEWYDAACCHAQAGQLDPAFASLRRAIDGGFRDAAHLDRDTDLASLHADPRWKTTRASLAEKLAAYRASINGELLDLFTADQGDRVGKIDWSVVNVRDEARRKRVDEILTAGGAKVADDFYHAAMVYQHGSTPAEVQRARDLALKAVALDATHARAKWLAAAAEDRVLMYEGKPQKYGTQFKKLEGKWVVWEVDPAVTDEERAKWNVPPLASAKARAEQMNATP
jgi:hypothetical protein